MSLRNRKNGCENGYEYNAEIEKLLYGGTRTLSDGTGEKGSRRCCTCTGRTLIFQMLRSKVVSNTNMLQETQK